MFEVTQGLKHDMPLQFTSVFRARTDFLYLLPCPPSPLGSYRESWTVKGNVSPTSFIVIPGLEEEID